MNYRNRHKRCRTCVFAKEDTKNWCWYCEAKNEMGGTRFLKEAGRAGMFCKFYAPKSFLRD